MLYPLFPSIQAPEALSKANAALGRWLVQSCESEGSRAVYKNDLQGFAAFLRTINADLLHITQDHVVAYLETLRNKNLSPATRAKKLTVIRGLLKSLTNEGLFPFAEYERIASLKAPKVSRDGRTPGLSQHEARQLLDAPDPSTLHGVRDRAILAAMFYTGARVSAICNIRIGHLLSEMGVYYVLLHEKGGRQVRAPLHPEASERIHLWLEKSGLAGAQETSFLFPPFNRRGPTPQATKMHERSIWHMLKTYSRKIGLKVDRLNERGICAHSARVTAITAAFAGGAKLEEVQQLVGHKDARNTLRYRRATPKDAQNAVLQIHYQ